MRHCLEPLHVGWRRQRHTPAPGTLKQRPRQKGNSCSSRPVLELMPPDTVKTELAIPRSPPRPWKPIVTTPPGQCQQTSGRAPGRRNRDGGEEDVEESNTESSFTPPVSLRETEDSSCAHERISSEEIHSSPESTTSHNKYNLTGGGKQKKSDEEEHKSSVFLLPPNRKGHQGRGRSAAGCRISLALRSARVWTSQDVLWQGHRGKRKWKLMAPLFRVTGRALHHSAETALVLMGSLSGRERRFLVPRLPVPR
ncbi:unnamed protein product [Pleuronectes platessa]|uniref:Uncharacterized protein n=1 Tax=Pleuronectes platessa TaxID=8262 RepID=A0A9N7VNM2_PLEPL|nr:unnamed protein product [Pleuronectes platessa]